MKRQIKRVLTILFAVLFVATLTASAVSAEEVMTLTDSAVSAEEVMTLTDSVVSAEEVTTQVYFTASVEDGFSCGNEPWWWWIHHHQPRPPRPVDPNPPDPVPDYSEIRESLDLSFKQNINFQ